MKSFKDSKIAEVLKFQQSAEKSSFASEFTQELDDFNSFLYDELPQKTAAYRLLPQDELKIDAQSVTDYLKRDKNFKKQPSIDLSFNSISLKLLECHKAGGPLYSPSNSHDTCDGTETSERLSFSCTRQISSSTDSEYSDTIGLASLS